MAKKFNDIQLSTILSEHDMGYLCIGGWTNWHLDSLHVTKAPHCCINQVSYNEPSIIKAYNINERVAKRFDQEYKKNLSSEKLLTYIEQWSSNGK